MISNQTNNTNAFMNYLGDFGYIYLPYAILSVLGVVFGTIGNLVVIFTIVLDKSLVINPAYMLMVNLALSDLGISTLVHIFTIIGITDGEIYFIRRPQFCVFLAAYCMITCATSLFTTGVLAFNRYIHICHNKYYKKLFTRNLSIFYCFLCWIGGCFMDVPNFAGWGGHIFDRKSANCIINRLSTHSFSIFLSFVEIFIPCLCILLMYIRIFVYFSMSKMKSKGKYDKNDVIKSIKVAQSLFASFLLFAICWAPLATIFSLDFEDKLSPEIHAITTLLAHVNSTMNPFFYIMFNPTFKQSFKRIFLQCCLKSNSVQNTENSVSISKKNYVNR